jgi:hypothetical protein
LPTSRGSLAAHAERQQPASHHVKGHELNGLHQLLPDLSLNPPHNQHEAQDEYVQDETPAR